MAKQPMDRKPMDLDLLPRDVDAEKALLGGLLLAGAQSIDVEQIARLIQVDDFTMHSHRRIYEAILAVTADGGFVDRVTVGFKLKDAGQLESIGGLTYLTALDDSMASVFGLDDYCTRIRRKSVARKGVLGLSKIIEELQLFPDSQETLDKAKSIVDDLERTNQTIDNKNQIKSAAVIIEQLGGVDKLFSHSEATVPLPWKRLSDVMGGGLRPAELTILASRPSIGKTSAALQITHYAARREEITTAVFSLEMSTQSLLTRMACQSARVDSQEIRLNCLSENSRRRLNVVVNEIADMPVCYDDTMACTISGIRASLDDMTSKLRLYPDMKPLGLVVIDYLQLLDAPGRFENRQQAVSHMSRELKKMTKEYNVPFLVLSQLRRVDNETNVPTLSELRESGSIEQDADNVLFLHPEEPGHGLVQRRTALIVAKQRNGPIDVIPMVFIAATQRLELPTAPGVDYAG